MSKKTILTDKYGGKCPSAYGSHKVMISEEWTAQLSDPEYVILDGDSGFYATTRDRLDNGTGDPNRYAQPETRADLLRRLLPGVEVVVNEDRLALKSAC